MSVLTEHVRRMQAEEFRAALGVFGGNASGLPDGYFPTNARRLLAAIQLGNLPEGVVDFEAAKTRLRTTSEPRRPRPGGGAA